MIDLLSTEGLVESGVVDFVWNAGWRRATPNALRRAQHGHPDDENSPVALPDRAVISCFTVNFPRALAQVGADGRGGGRYVFIVRDGDPSLRDGGGKGCNVGAWPSFVYHLFGSALIEQTSRATAMPMAFHAFKSSTELVDCTRMIPREVGNRVLVSFSLDLGGVTAREGSERRRAIDYFRDKPWATVNEDLLAWRPGQPNVNPWPWSDYAAKLRRYDYLVVPVGYGVERVAQWEAMALGTIPICIWHPELAHFADMPIAFVHDWNEVTPEWCDANLGVIGRSMEKLKLSYWVERVRQKRVELGI